MSTTATDRHWLERAARAALRGVGRVEPNPLVGAAIVRDNKLIALGHHRVFGDMHAERDAIDRARQLGRDTRGATMYVTLEPCAHTGKQPPCADAIIHAGIAEVVYARSDPHDDAAGGAQKLQSAGIRARVSSASPLATRLSDPFIKRTTTDLPWVIAKWAQTIDGKIATRTGDSKWISSQRSRQLVHRIRSRVDAVMTGIGTVLADDPQLTSRDAASIRRHPARIIVDPQLATPEHATLVRTAHEHPTLVLTTQRAIDHVPDHARSLESHSIQLVACPKLDSTIDLRDALATLRREHSIDTVLVESGGGLVGQLARADLLDELIVFIAPKLLADADAIDPARGSHTAIIADVTRFELVDVRTRDGDAMLVYRKPTTAE